MDPIPGSKDGHESIQPKSAVEEAMMRIAMALEGAGKEYDALPLLSLRKRWYMEGVMKALVLILELLHDLHHKYDNQRGDFN